MAEKELEKVRKEKHNMKCADCDEKSEWGFGAVVVPYGSFVCNLCKQVRHRYTSIPGSKQARLLFFAQAHQAYSHRVKSVTMSNWTMAEVDALRYENGGGNKNCRKSWHGKGKAPLPAVQVHKHR